MNEFPRAAILVRAVVLVLGACVGDPAPSAPPEALPDTDVPVSSEPPAPLPEPEPVLVPAGRIPELDEPLPAPPVPRVVPRTVLPTEPDGRREPAPTCGPCCHGHCDENTPFSGGGL